MNWFQKLKTRAHEEPQALIRQLNRFFYILIVLIPTLLAVFLQPTAPNSDALEPGSLAAQSSVDAIAEPILPVPQTFRLDWKKVALGRRLFNDKRLSKDETISCASCHDLERGGDDGLPFSKGIKNKRGQINAPTVFNAVFNFRQFWDGRARDLKHQASFPVENPEEMGVAWKEVIKRLESEPYYVEQIEQIYSDIVTADHVQDAIAEFEKSLFTPNARFDRFLRGNADAITAVEKEGYRLFKNFGCVACHQGVNVGGNMYQMLGVVGDYFKDRGGITEADYGLYNVTQKEADRYTFKVPSLRNIALTAPYFHDGSQKTLHAAVGTMARYQLGRQLSAPEIDKIVGFLNTLTGEYQGKPL